MSLVIISRGLPDACGTAKECQRVEHGGDDCGEDEEELKAEQAKH